MNERESLEKFGTIAFSDQMLRLIQWDPVGVVNGHIRIYLGRYLAFVPEHMRWAVVEAVMGACHSITLERAKADRATLDRIRVAIVRAAPAREP